MRRTAIGMTSMATAETTSATPASVNCGGWRARYGHSASSGRSSGRCASAWSFSLCAGFTPSDWVVLWRLKTVLF